MDSLERKIRSLPQNPGVYQYFDRNGKLLYIGKAKNLKKRVKSYFRLVDGPTPAPNLSPRIFKMVSEVKDLDYIVVKSEQDALILENSLIKQLKPKYNILLRDDKTYPYIYIDFSSPFPRPKITRKVVKGKRVKYFGPFPSAAKDILSAIYELFPLVQKDSCLNEKRACLFYQMHRCLAPCEGKIDTKTYGRILQEAIAHIHDKKLLLQKLSIRMNMLAQQLRFEEAAKIRDAMARIEATQSHSQIDLAKVENIDIYAIAHNESRAAIVRMFLREGKVVASSSSFVPFDARRGFDKEEAYKRALLEFYTSLTPFTASTILVAHDFEEREELQKLITQKIGKNVHIQHPKRGKKKELVDLAMLNARELLKKESKNEDVLHQIQRLFDTATIPARIEIFDNSHISGSIPVGAMVVYENGVWKKGEYRHYNLETKDEYHQMREMLTRRCESFAKNPPPDLWVIDGGETLRQLACDILQSFGVDMDVIAIAKEKRDAKAQRAKGKAKDIIYAKNGVYKLSPNDKRLLFIQKLRDEAHRFAITFHKKQRIKKAKEIELLKTKGIGEAKVKKLLSYFGTFENIKKASLEELATVLNEKDALSLKKSYR